ncbi:jg3165 [Pararge aegeria aegeria]|uniref:Jg3165 protein n=1 Tax=Pararge aegeria aegeria TaxID=348720 RepID=A0A8S4QFT2_9NEOP|nr:jg3165 [Pararge aegeria aegeria]
MSRNWYPGARGAVRGDQPRSRLSNFARLTLRILTLELSRPRVSGFEFRVSSLKFEIKSQVSSSRSDVTSDADLLVQLKTTSSSPGSLQVSSFKFRVSSFKFRVRLPVVVDVTSDADLRVQLKTTSSSPVPSGPRNQRLQGQYSPTAEFGSELIDGPFHPRP